LPDTVFTIGHSTHSLEDFIAILKAWSIERLADIRTVPRSRTNPWFNRGSLPAALKSHGIVYEHIPALGGLRRAHKDSLNTGWRNLSFRGYADYMSTRDFAGGIDALLESANGNATVIMCAEAVPWRCHRNLVADALTARGIHVEHIMSGTKAQPHAMTPFAVVKGDAICYPGGLAPES
jgi:uncharacterized protein (DUF488 family)